MTVLAAFAVFLKASTEEALATMTRPRKVIKAVNPRSR
jgi:hypothetical protein